MQSYKLIPHTADLRLYAKSDTLVGLFAAALEGMAEVLKNGGCAARRVPIAFETISLTGQDATTLLIGFLSEVLTRSYLSHAIFCTVTFTQCTEKSLDATIHGVQSSTFDEDIKAVTYHEAEVKKNSEGVYEVVIVFDI